MPGEGIVPGSLNGNIDFIVFFKLCSYWRIKFKAMNITESPAGRYTMIKHGRDSGNAANLFRMFEVFSFFITYHFYKTFKLKGLTPGGHILQLVKTILKCVPPRVNGSLNEKYRLYYIGNEKSGISNQYGWIGSIGEQDIGHSYAPHPY